MITINLEKARTITHVKRRAARDREMAPLDIQVTIPGRATLAEEARQNIRNKYAIIQNTIDDPNQTTISLKGIIDTLYK